MADPTARPRRVWWKRVRRRLRRTWGVISDGGGHRGQHPVWKRFWKINYKDGKARWPAAVPKPPRLGPGLLTRIWREFRNTVCEDTRVYPD